MVLSKLPPLAIVHGILNTFVCEMRSNNQLCTGKYLTYPHINSINIASFWWFAQETGSSVCIYMAYDCSHWVSLFYIMNAQKSYAAILNKIENATLHYFIFVTKNWTKSIY